MPSEKLEFTKQEPAFLRKLREQHGGPRNNVQIARPKKDRLRNGDDDEDEPVIVDESGENVAKEEWEDMLKREKDGEIGNGGAADSQVSENTSEIRHDGASRDVHRVADIGGTKKRKMGKIIGDHEKEAEDKHRHQDRPGADSTIMKTAAKVENDSARTKAKKKTKKIKLSFDEAE